MPVNSIKPAHKKKTRGAPVEIPAAAPNRGQARIIHIDMDAFFASVEQRDHAEWRGQPLVVGHAGERGVVAAASYEARAFGIRSAMSSFAAAKRCPWVIFAPGRFDAYKQVSEQIHAIFHEYTDLVEPLSLDEAYLDVSARAATVTEAAVIAEQIRTKIKEQTGLTASAGVSINKMLAKIASDYRKPDGLFMVTEHEAEAFVEELRVEQFWGVGPATAAAMHRLGIRTGADLKRCDADFLRLHFGKMGALLYDFARARDHRAVEPAWVRKSMGAEQTWPFDTDAPGELDDRLQEVSRDVWRRLERNTFRGKTVTLKLKYADFEQITRSTTLSAPLENPDQLLDTARLLLSAIDHHGKKIRLVGISLSRTEQTPTTDAFQLELDFDWPTP